MMISEKLKRKSIRKELKRAYYCNQTPSLKDLAKSKKTETKSNFHIFKIIVKIQQNRITQINFQIYHRVLQNQSKRIS